jgi:hypothetical protein
MKNRKEPHAEKETLERAAEDKREGRAASTQAGEFVREEVEHVREGKHGARSTKQAIAIGLSKARRVGVKLSPPKKGKASKKTRERATSEKERALKERSQQSVREQPRVRSSVKGTARYLRRRYRARLEAQQPSVRQPRVRVLRKRPPRRVRNRSLISVEIRDRLAGQKLWRRCHYIGGHAPTPDQNIVDEIGRAVGFDAEEGEELRTSEERTAQRDRKRWELDRRSAASEPADQS